VKVELHYLKERKNPVPTEHPEDVVETVSPAKRYKFGKSIGRGSFGEVKRVTDKVTGKEYAAKIIDKKKNKMKEEDIRQLKAEIDIMTRLDHPNIVRLYETFDIPPKLTVLILELVTGGELFQALIKRSTPYYERDAAEIMRNVMRGVEYMHSMGICHRDLKPENLLIQGDDPRNIKITDFGLSKDFSKAQMVTSCGTASYAAPEVLSGKHYTSYCDIWSCGVIGFVLLTAEFPFYGKTEAEIFKTIEDYRYDFKKEIWDRISNNAKDFISNIFVPPEQRMDAKQCLEHPWLQNQEDTTKSRKISKFGHKLSRLVLVNNPVITNSITTIIEDEE